MSLRFDEEAVDLGVNCDVQFASGVLDLAELDIGGPFVIGFEFLEHHNIGEFQEVLENLVCLDLRDLDELIQEHF